MKRFAGLSIAAIAATLALTGTASADTGAFAIGDQSAAIGSQVTFWGAQWWKDNSLSQGAAPASFKGFADSSTATCGEQWTTRPGNSSTPPASVSGLVPMVVSTQITKSGPVISGDTKEVVMVQVDPGYEPNPGHPGTGTVEWVVCGGTPVLVF